MNFLGVPLHHRPVCLVQSSAHDIKLRVLILHGSFHVPVPYRFHYCCQVPGIAEDTRSVIVSSAIQHQIIRQSCLLTSQPELVRHIRQVTAFWALRREHPSFLSPASAHLFGSYDWPGDVRELQNVVERAVILCDGETFSVDPSWLGRAAHFSASPSVRLAAGVAQHEKTVIEQALREAGGQLSGPAGAAARLGIPRQTLESEAADQPLSF
jgi:hypothetical protein